MKEIKQVLLKILRARKYGRYEAATLTVEAAFVLPIFLYLMIGFLFYMQIFTVQERIQSEITKMGLELTKSAYIIKDFQNPEEAISFDFTVFGETYDIGIRDFVANHASNGFLKLYAMKYLNDTQINKSCIQGGYAGIDFTGSKVFHGNDYVDIVVSYRVKLPLNIFIADDIPMIQRVRLRCWTGYAVEPAYRTAEEDRKEELVYITATGRVYHKNEACSHIKLSITSVQGIPSALRNENGGKYYPCEECCKDNQYPLATFYITSDGTRYHSRRDCSKIKRNVREIPISQIGDRTPCKRCLP